jgi:hypothetical protein
VLSRAFAWLLVVLAASPFTAPFSTCDVSTLMAAPQFTLGVSVQHAAFTASSARPTAGSILDEEQFKDTALTAIAAAVPVSMDADAIVQIAPRTSAFRTPFVTLRL